MSEEKPRRTDEEVVATFHNAKSRAKCSDELSMRVEKVNQDEGTVEFSFVGKEEWTNPMGGIQGGFMAAMLDDTMSVTGVVGANFTKVMPTLEFKVSFLHPAKPGKFKTIGRWVRMGRSIAFIEAELFDANDALVAKSSGTVTPRPIPGRE